MHRFRLTFLFVVTSLVVIVVATFTVNHTVGELAEDNLIRIAEENTARDGLHIQSMMRGQHSMNSMTSAEATTDGDAIQDMQQPMRLTLESTASQLDSSFPSLVEGLKVVKFNLFDLNGNTSWSTDPGTIGISKRESPLYQKALAGDVSSKLAKDHEVITLDGVRSQLDVVETYMPLREVSSGPIIGVLEIYRDVGSDVAIQVDEAKTTVLRTTVATMGWLFLVLVGFIVVADVTIYRARRREMALVENQLTEREQAAEELSRSNKELEQFAYVASHDLKEPLRMVSSYTQLLAKRYKSKLDGDANEFIEYAVDGASRMQLLIDDLLAYSRVSTQGRAPEPTDCNAAFNTAVVNLKATIEENGASVSCDPLPTVRPTALSWPSCSRTLSATLSSTGQRNRLVSTCRPSSIATPGGSWSKTTASGSTPNTPNASSSSFSDSTPRKSTQGQGSAWPSVRRS